MRNTIQQKKILVRREVISGRYVHISASWYQKEEKLKGSINSITFDILMAYSGSYDSISGPPGMPYFF